MDYNKVILAGRITADPMVRATPSGMSVASMSLATNRKWTDKGGQKQEETQFHNLVVWGKQADFVGQYLKKGDSVLIDGRLQTRKWTNKAGQEVKTTEVMVENVQSQPRAKSGQEKALPSLDDLPIVDLEDK